MGGVVETAAVRAFCGPVGPGDAELWESVGLGDWRVAGLQFRRIESLEGSGWAQCTARCGRKGPGDERLGEPRAEAVGEGGAAAGVGGAGGAGAPAPAPGVAPRTGEAARPPPGGARGCGTAGGAGAYEGGLTGA